MLFVLFVMLLSDSSLLKFFSFSFRSNLISEIIAFLCFSKSSLILFKNYVVLERLDSTDFIRWIKMAVDCDNWFKIQTKFVMLFLNVNQSPTFHFSCSCSISLKVPLKDGFCPYVSLWCFWHRNGTNQGSFQQVWRNLILTNVTFVQYNLKVIFDKILLK